ncbi:MAG: BlaI/MecI/CopY family transcriptional regulator [Acidobacteriota bacterium]|nr:BlaI/MecI/CopY family transcriptional regulator [Acidobacteriota bacterium]
MTSKGTKLSKREQEVMELLYRQGEMSASDIQAGMTDAPTNSAVRSILRLLVEKGHALRKQDGFRYLYAPAVGRDQAGRSALKNLLKTFFQGSPQKAFVQLVDLSKEEMAEEDWERLSNLIQKAKEEER